MLGADTAGYAVERLDAAPDGHWMHRFLGPGLVECLAPAALQSVFRAFTPLVVEAGEIVVREGESAELFYVIADGSAEVRRDGHRIAALMPGDSFGSDALVSGSHRNATVVMSCDGRLMCLAAATFRCLLADRLVRRGQLSFVFVPDAEGRARLRAVSLGGRRDDRVEVLAGLSSGEMVVETPPPDLADGRRVAATGAAERGLAPSGASR
jgi:hypothetical protein